MESYLLLLGRRALSGKLRCGLNLQSRHDDRAMGEDGRCPSDGDECGNVATIVGDRCFRRETSSEPVGRGGRDSLRDQG